MNIDGLGINLMECLIFIHLSQYDTILFVYNFIYITGYIS
jgi:hypothetical protein